MFYTVRKSRGGHYGGWIIWVADYAITPENIVNYAITPKSSVNYASENKIAYPSSRVFLHLEMKEVSINRENSRVQNEEINEYVNWNVITQKYLTIYAITPKN